MTTRDDAPGRDRGVALFDGDPKALGWCANAAGERVRLRLDEVPAGVWWTDLSPLDATRPGLLTASYLPVTHARALRDWGHDARDVEPAYAATLCAELFDRVLRIADGIDGGTPDPGHSLAERLARALPFPRRGEGTATLPPGFHPRVPAPRDGGFAFERPTLTAVAELFDMPVPEGDELLATPLDAAGAAGAIAGNDRPCIAEVTVGGDDLVLAAGIVPGRRWVAHPELVMLHRFHAIEAHAGLSGGTYARLMDRIPPTWSAFLSDDANAVSWSAGIVAEAMLDAVTASDLGRRTWAGEWLASNAGATTAIDLLRVSGLGCRVGGADGRRIWLDEDPGTPWRRIRDMAAAGFLPEAALVPPKVMPPTWPLEWGGTARDQAAFDARVFRDMDVLWNLDRIPLLPESHRPGLMRRIHRHFATAYERFPRN